MDIISVEKERSVEANGHFAEWPFPCGNGHNLKWPFKITIAAEQALNTYILFNAKKYIFYLYKLPFPGPP